MFLFRHVPGNILIRVKITSRLGLVRKILPFYPISLCYICSTKQDDTIYQHCSIEYLYAAQGTLIKILMLIQNYHWGHLSVELCCCLNYSYWEEGYAIESGVWDDVIILLWESSLVSLYGIELPSVDLPAYSELAPTLLCKAALCDEDTYKVSGFGQKDMLYSQSKIPLYCTIIWVSLPEVISHLLSTPWKASCCKCISACSITQTLKIVLKESGPYYMWERSGCIYVLGISNYSVSINLLIIEIKQVSGWAQHFKGILTVH